MIEAQTLAMIDTLQADYIRSLNSKDMTGWLACFAPGNGQYECSTSESDEQELHLPLMLDDCYARLQDRVLFITEVWSGTYTDYATRHFVQRLNVRRGTDGLYQVTTNFLVAYTTTQRQTEILVAGRYEDEIAVDETAAAFVKKRAILDTITTPRYLVYPI